MAEPPKWYIIRKKHLRKRIIVGIIGFTIMLVFLIWLMVERWFPIWLGVYCIAYPICIIILFFHWKVSIFGRHFRAKLDRFFEIYDNYGFLKEIKDPHERQYWINFYRKRITLAIVNILFPIVPAIYAIVMTGNLAIIGVILLVVLLLIWQLYEYSDVVWVNRGEKTMKKKKRELRKFRSRHPT